jgi:hypothetical protein
MLHKEAGESYSTNTMCGHCKVPLVTHASRNSDENTSQVIKTNKKCKLRLMYNCSTEHDLSSKVRSSTHPTQCSVGQVHLVWSASSRPLYTVVIFFNLKYLRALAFIGRLLWSFKNYKYTRNKIFHFCCQFDTYFSLPPLKTRIIFNMLCPPGYQVWTTIMCFLQLCGSCMKRVITSWTTRRFVFISHGPLPIVWLGHLNLSAINGKMVCEESCKNFCALFIASDLLWHI